MKVVNLLVKPASSLCNMRCGYCFYEDVSSHWQAKSCSVMSQETARRLIQSAFEAVDEQGRVIFAFQGGEPTLAGVDFFRAFLAMEQEYARPGITVEHAIQTNGLLLDDAWLDLFVQGRFLVGLSIDGTKPLNDLYRVDAAGRSSWNRVTRALALLQKKKVEYNLLCVVTAQCAAHPQKVYQSLKKLGGQYLQFIPCLDPLEEEPGNRAYSLLPEQYGAFLCTLFDLWYTDWRAGQYVSIRLFEDYVHLAMGLPAGSCAASGHCGSYCVVEGDGSLYPCDFYVLDEWKLGIIGTHGILRAVQSERAQQFLADGEQLPADCTACCWRILCNGGCKRNWVNKNGPVKNYYCPAFKTFFEYAASRLAEIAAAEIRAMQQG